MQSSFENDVIKLKNSELDLYKNLEEYKNVKETSEKVRQEYKENLKDLDKILAMQNALGDYLKNIDQEIESKLLQTQNLYAEQGINPREEIYKKAEDTQQAL